MKIFDSLVHPLLSGKKNKHGISTSFEDIHASLAGTGIEKLMAIGMPTEDYEHLKFFQECQKYSAFIPVAALTLSEAPEKELHRIKDIGYSAIKIHPRSLAGTLSVSVLQKALEEAALLDLRVLLCTYCFFDVRSATHLLLDEIVRVVSRSPRSLKLMLVHGGVFDLLKILEMSKYSDNILVDLSYTMMKYKGSSMDLDIDYAMNFFDRRVCIGSDYPDFTLKDFSERALLLSKELPDNKRENILYRNLSAFMDLK